MKESGKNTFNVFFFTTRLQAQVHFRLAAARRLAVGSQGVQVQERRGEFALARANKDRAKTK